MKIKVGYVEVGEVKSARLLGMMLDNDQKWTSPFWGKKGLLKSLNQSLFAIRRISNLIPQKQIETCGEQYLDFQLRIWTAAKTQGQTDKGGQVNKEYQATQIAQNKLL